MVSICLEIETTRDIARQILRHRSFSFQNLVKNIDPKKIQVLLLERQGYRIVRIGKIV